MHETAEARLKRLSMRSWRRGTKEMDLILGPYSDAHLAGMDAADLALYDRLLNENDQDLITWVLGQPDLPTAPPTDLCPLVVRIAAFARSRMAPKT